MYADEYVTGYWNKVLFSSSTVIKEKVQSLWTEQNQYASISLGLIKRTLPPCSQHLKSIVYKTLVGPKFKYVSELWNLHTIECNKKVAQAQRNPSRFIFQECNGDADISLNNNNNNNGYF